MSDMGFIEVCMKVSFVLCVFFAGACFRGILDEWKRKKHQKEVEREAKIKALEREAQDKFDKAGRAASLALFGSDCEKGMEAIQDVPLGILDEVVEEEMIAFYKALRALYEYKYGPIDDSRASE